MAKIEYQVEVKELPDLTVAYARHVGRFDGLGEAFGRLGRWAGPRGLYARPGALGAGAIQTGAPRARKSEGAGRRAPALCEPGHRAVYCRARPNVVASHRCSWRNARLCSARTGGSGKGRKRLLSLTVSVMDRFHSR